MLKQEDGLRRHELTGDGVTNTTEPSDLYLSTNCGNWSKQQKHRVNFTHLAQAHRLAKDTLLLGKQLEEGILKSMQLSRNKTDVRVVLISLRRQHQDKIECECYVKSTLGFWVLTHKYIFVLVPETKRLKLRLKMLGQVTVNYSDYVSTQQFVCPASPLLLMLMSIV